MDDDVRQIHEVFLDLVGLFNQPERDTTLLEKAGIQLDRALFPLLVRIERRGPIGVVELAGLAGRDYTTVSRQVSKLVELELVSRKESANDKRISAAVVTKEGKAMTHSLDIARGKLMGKMLENWNEKDKKNLLRLLQKFAGSFAKNALAQS